MEVKNTFIDIPPTPTGLPVPLASAPAQCGFSMMDSLAGAAQLEEPSSLTEGALKMQNKRPIRMKPNELAFCSTQSMMSIPESPSGFCGQTVTRSLGPSVLGQPVTGFVRKVPDRLRFDSGASEGTIPPTPVGMVNFGSTPTGTPYGGFTMLPPMTAPAVTTFMAAPAQAPSVETVMAAPVMAAPMMAATVAASKTKLSLVDMISPKGEMKIGSLQSAFGGYTLPPGASPVVMQTSQPPPPPQYLPAVSQQSTVMVGAPTLPPPSFPAPGVSSVLQELPASSGTAAAVSLGLMSAPTTMRIPSPSSTAVGTLPPQYFSSGPVLQAQAPATAVLPPAMLSQPNAQTVTYMSAPQAAPTMTVNSQPQRMIPPPPLAMAPMTVFSPSGAGPPAGFALPTPTSPESDMKVLLDMAVASGNQKAVDALIRQAQQSGMSPDKLRSMMPPSGEPMVMSTSPVSR